MRKVLFAAVVGVTAWATMLSPMAQTVDSAQAANDSMAEALHRMGLSIPDKPFPKAVAGKPDIESVMSGADDPIPTESDRKADELMSPQ